MHTIHVTRLLTKRPTARPPAGRSPRRACGSYRACVSSQFPRVCGDAAAKRGPIKVSGAAVSVSFLAECFW